MKYHYQFVSATTVRIELIPEDQKETHMIERLARAGENSPELLELYTNGLQGYHLSAVLTKTNFMNFPTVALCGFLKVKDLKEIVA